MRQGGLQRINGDKTKWVMRKVRKMIKAFDILEEQFVNVNETMVADMADLAVNISSNSANLKSNNLHILDIQVSTYNTAIIIWFILLHLFVDAI